MEGLAEIITDFFNSIGQTRSCGHVGSNVRFARKRTRLGDLRECAKAFTPFCLDGHTENLVGGGMKKSNKYNARIVRDCPY
jgi:hypothetical protein